MVRAILQRGQFPGFTLVVLVAMVVWSSMFSEDKLDPWVFGGVPIVLSLGGSFIYWFVYYRTGKKTDVSPTEVFAGVLDGMTMCVLACFIYDSFVPNDIMFKNYSLIYLALCWVLALWGSDDTMSECKIFVSSLYLTPLLVYAAIAYEKNRENR